MHNTGKLIFIFSFWSLKTRPLNTGDCLIQVIFKTGLTIPYIDHLNWTLVLLKRCHAHFWFSANQITWSVLLLQIQIFNGKQCRSRSVGFFSSQLIWIYTVCKGRVYPGSAGQGLTFIFPFWGLKTRPLNTGDWLIQVAFKTGWTIPYIDQLNLKRLRVVKHLQKCTKYVEEISGSLTHICAFAFITRIFSIQDLCSGISLYLCSISVTSSGLFYNSRRGIVKKKNVGVSKLLPKRVAPVIKKVSDTREENSSFLILINLQKSRRNSSCLCICHCPSCWHGHVCIQLSGHVVNYFKTSFGSLKEKSRPISE